MANAYSANAGALIAGADAARDAQMNIDATINLVQADADAAVPLWVSAGAASAQNAIASWISSARRICNVLTKLEADLRGTDAAYEAAEEEHEATFKSLAGRMGDAPPVV